MEKLRSEDFLKDMKYQKPLIKKEKKMNFSSDLINKLGKRVICKQCSSCHGCR